MLFIRDNPRSPKKQERYLTYSGMELADKLNQIDDEARVLMTSGLYKQWMPKRVVFTPEAFDEPYGQKIYQRISSLNIKAEILKNNRITGLRGETARETHKIAKNTLAIVNVPPGARADALKI